ncbi:MAG: DUF5615 family PIN-like protein [Burkholderiales bacterium]|nr:DUF5615 family PIN-like protein [Burkholderiales bacterium]
MSSKVAIPFFTDQNVPESASQFFADMGHPIVRLREVMAITTPDPVIAVACSQSGQVLVTHDTDFRQASKRLKITQREYREKLHRILLSCDFATDVDRLKDAWSVIEHEWSLINGSRPMSIEIRKSSIITFR